MEEVRNLNGKRICDVSADGKTIIISIKGCATYITANPDGTFNFRDVIHDPAAYGSITIAKKKSEKAFMGEILWRLFFCPERRI